MTETRAPGGRSAGLSYQQLLDADSHPVREILRTESPMAPGSTRVTVERYFSKDFHDLEVEKLWKRVWQLACHEDDIPEVGDYLVYDIAHLSYLVVRSAPDEIRAFPNACLHRGRTLRDGRGRRARDIRCPFHGWSWKLDGRLNEVPCHWDFPSVDEESHSLPRVQLGRWGGFVFINPDPQAEPLDEYLAGLSDHFTLLPFEKRIKVGHVAKILRCNWKLAQEAFMEAYHVVATHPVILPTIGDANSQYDVFGNFSRALSPSGTPSPHLTGVPAWDAISGANLYTKVRHPLSGFVYARDGDERVAVTDHKGEVSRFTNRGEWLEGPLGQADPHLCDWVGGRLLPGSEAAPASESGSAAESASLRAKMAAPGRERLRESLGDDADQVSDAELIDSIYYTVFPNFHPWGSFNPLVYRFRPNGSNPEECIHEAMLFVPAPADGARPHAAQIHWLGPDDDWVDAPELGMLAKVFNQDVFNLPKVQQGLHNLQDPHAIFGDYGETKIRHFHALLDAWLARP